MCWGGRKPYFFPDQKFGSEYHDLMQQEESDEFQFDIRKNSNGHFIMKQNMKLVPTSFKISYTIHIQNLQKKL